MHVICRRLTFISQALGPEQGRVLQKSFCRHDAFTAGVLQAVKYILQHRWYVRAWLKHTWPMACCTKSPWCAGSPQSLNSMDW